MNVSISMIPNARVKTLRRWIIQLFLGFCLVATFSLNGDPFGLPVRYPLVPSTFLGRVQLGSKALEEGAVIAFYQGHELRGRFTLSSTQIVGGNSYFNAVIQNSGKPELLTKAVLWIPQTGMLYERSLNISMPLADTYADFDVIETFSFSELLTDSQIIPTLLIPRFEGFMTQEGQALWIPGASLTGIIPNNLPALDLSTPSGSRLSWSVENQGFTYHPINDFLGSEWILIPLQQHVSMDSFYLHISVESIELEPDLRIARQAEKVVLSWEGPYYLMVTQDLNIPFLPLVDAKSPYIAGGEDQMFYRLASE